MKPSTPIYVVILALSLAHINAGIATLPGIAACTLSCTPVIALVPVYAACITACMAVITVSTACFDQDTPVHVWNSEGYVEQV